MAATFGEAATSQARQAKVTGTVVQPNDALHLKSPQRLKHFRKELGQDLSERNAMTMTETINQQAVRDHATMLLAAASSSQTPSAPPLGQQ